MYSRLDVGLRQGGLARDFSAVTFEGWKNFETLFANDYQIFF